MNTCKVIQKNVLQQEQIYLPCILKEDPPFVALTSNDHSKTYLLKVIPIIITYVVFFQLNFLNY